MVEVLEKLQLRVLGPKSISNQPIQQSLHFPSLLDLNIIHNHRIPIPKQILVLLIFTHTPLQPRNLIPHAHEQHAHPLQLLLHLAVSRDKVFLHAIRRGVGTSLLTVHLERRKKPPHPPQPPDALLGLLPPSREVLQAGDELGVPLRLERVGLDFPFGLPRRRQGRDDPGVGVVRPDGPPPLLPLRIITTVAAPLPDAQVQPVDLLCDVARRLGRVHAPCVLLQGVV
ncbi:hypothetical protein VM1G_11959 [Cytospora mali]|uniref:Uncharacterized protein n=1 Tax=Cytospora mali TaxID=578113 RepID=A0A194WCZ0_CYTMA|nr:hypothetical protein VM1G_11959 [Valsa mali]